jgi:hypothetical protein
MLGVGIGINAIQASIEGGGGGGSYTTHAVNVAGPDVSLRCASLTAINNGLFSYVIWYKLAAYNQFTAVLAVGDPTADYFMDADLGRDGGSTFDGHPGSEADSEGFVARTVPTDALDVWHSLIVSVDTNQPAGQKVAVSYLDDALWPYEGTVDDIEAAFVMPFNGREFFVFDDGFSDGVTGEFADYAIYCGKALHEVDGTISVATRRLFVTADNKPVDPAVAAAVLGAPTCLFSGDATSFVTNQGNGGAFTLTGSLTNATTSPSD